MRVYGPVPSRRFGLSLGIDVIPKKTCSFDCIYCQVGQTDKLTAKPAEFFSPLEIISDVKEALDQDERPDIITFAGSGEPTLYKPLGELIDGLRELTDIPILLITNSSLFWREEVADAVRKVDILAPSLDAGDPVTFNKLNKPHREITFDRLIRGLIDVTHRFKGEIRLEVMLVRDVNDSDESLRAIAMQLGKMRFDQIDLNTPVRPPVPNRGALPCFAQTLKRAKEILGPKAKSIGNFEERGTEPAGKTRSFYDVDKDILEILKRRPCTVEDIARSQNLATQAALESLNRLEKAGLILSDSESKAGYYRIPSK